MHKYVLRTHLLENPEVVFYYKGFSKVDPIAPMAMRCVVGFTADDAHVFNSFTEAQALCNRLNKDRTALREGGYAEFKVLWKYHKSSQQINYESQESIS